MCTMNLECISDFCFNHECQVKSVIFPAWVWAVLILIITGGLLLFLGNYIRRYKRGPKNDLLSALEHMAEKDEKRQPLLPKGNDGGDSMHKLLQ